jgi:hypothetical protein
MISDFSVTSSSYLSTVWGNSLQLLIALEQGSSGSTSFGPDLLNFLVLGSGHVQYRISVSGSAHYKVSVLGRGTAQYTIFGPGSSLSPGRGSRLTRRSLYWSESVLV